MIDDFPLGTYYLSAGRPASGLVTINYAPIVGDTVTVDGTVYTFGTDFFGPTPAIAAQSLAACMSGNWRVSLTSHPTALVRSHYGRSLGNFIVVVATVPGTGGNSLALAVSNSVRFTVSGATLAGGTSPAASSSVAVTDIEDGTGDSVMDAVNDAVRVNVVAGSGSGTEYVEDAAAAANPQGGALIMVRDDALSGQTTTDGDNVAARGTDKGELYVKHADSIAVSSAELTTLAGAVAGTEVQVDVLTMPTVTVNAHAVTNAGTFAVQVDGAALTSLQLIDDIIATLGTTTYTEAATKGAIVGAVRRDADTTLADTTNEIAPLIVDARGCLKVEAFSGETLPVSLTSTTVTGTVAVTQSGTWDEVGIHDSGNSITVDNGGTFAVQATAVGTIADDATTPGAPVMVGGVAVETDGTDPTSVSAEDDVARARTDRNRRWLVNDCHPNHWTVFENHTSAQTNNQLKAASGANLSYYITDLVISNGATAGTAFLVEDEGGTPVQITQTLYLAINGGAALHFKTPKRMTANKTLGFTSATVTTHSIEVHGYIAP